MLTVSVTKDYLLIPVKLRAPKLLLTVFSAEDREKKLYEWETPFPRDGEEPDYSVAVPVRRHRGETLLVCGSLPDEELARITLADERPPRARQAGYSLFPGKRLAQRPERPRPFVRRRSAYVLPVPPLRRGVGPDALGLRLQP